MAGTSSAPSFDEALCLLRANSQPDFFRCAEALFAILKRAAPKGADGVASLGEARVRSLNKEAPSFQANVAAVKGGVRFLRAAGFVDDVHGGHLLLPDGADAARVAAARGALKAAVATASELTAASQREADARRAADNAEATGRLVELKRVQAKNGATRTAAQEAERLRILRELQAERFEKARQADPHNFC